MLHLQLLVSLCFIFSGVSIPLLLPLLSSHLMLLGCTVLCMRSLKHSTRLSSKGKSFCIQVHSLAAFLTTQLLWVLAADYQKSNLFETYTATRCYCLGALQAALPFCQWSWRSISTSCIATWVREGSYRSKARKWIAFFFNKTEGFQQHKMGIL